MAGPRSDAARVTRSALWISWVVEGELRRLDLTTRQYRLLAQLRRGAAHASTIAAELAMRRPSFSAMADLLVGRGLVSREVDPADRRRVTYSLTPTGTTLLDEADHAIAGRLDDAAATLGEDSKRATDSLVIWSDAFARSVVRARRRRGGSDKAG